MSAIGAVAVRFEGATFSYRPRGRQAVAVLDGLDLQLEAGVATALIGPNGCGKSTILDLACGLLKPDSGSVSGEQAALMPQSDMLLPWAGALDNAAIALRAAGTSKAAARAAAVEWFERLDLHGFEHARPHELSGGMRQRVAFVRTVITGRTTLALDEPFSALDSLTRLEARDWLRQALAKSAATALLVTHDVSEAIELAERVVVLSPRPAKVVGSFSVTAETRSDPVAADRLRREVLDLLAVPV